MVTGKASASAVVVAVGSDAESTAPVDPVLQPVRAATRRVAAARGAAMVRFIRTP